MFFRSDRVKAPASGLSLALVAVAAGLAGCAREGEEGNTAAALDAAPPVIGHTVGPQPGPDRPLPPMDNPFAGDRVAAVEGRRLFTWFNCEGCHGTRAGGGMGPSLRDVTWIYGGEDQDIFNSIAEGRARGMPAWGTRLPSEQVWKLVTYIQTLETDREPNPPPPNPSYPDPPPPRRPQTTESYQ
jgi:cytochrome c oxidase cbb3-type subunit 3